MTTIWLIVEDKNDALVVKEILRKRGLFHKVEPILPSGGGKGISRLAKQLDKLITDTKRKKKAQDCIAVLHDADEQTQTDRTLYNQIKTICHNHRQDVALIIAFDEIESWLLADSGLCRWLDISPKNWDNSSKPSATLESLLTKQKRMKFQGPNRAKVLSHLEGTGDQVSPSMKVAVAFLNKAPCNMEDT
jgi:hypothetical protein